LQAAEAMPRMPRRFFADLTVHLLRRGINRAAIFGDDMDRELFLFWFRKAMTQCDVAVHAITLMTTHYHAMVTPPCATALSNAMKSLGEDYVRHFNRRYGRIGTLWTGRYTGIAIGDEPYWVTCLRYIELNPVRAEIVRDPAAYAWSSYLHHAVRDTWPWLDDHSVYLALGRTPDERRKAYRALCIEPLSETDLNRQRLAREDRPATFKIDPESEGPSRSVLFSRTGSAASAPGREI
jgi:REP-associated tyrosine transposase